MRGYGGSVGIRGYQWGHQAFPSDIKSTFMAMYKPKLFTAQSELRDNLHLLHSSWDNQSTTTTPASQCPLSLLNQVTSQEILPYLSKIASKKFRTPQPNPTNTLTPGQLDTAPQPLLNI